MPSPSTSLETLRPELGVGLIEFDAAMDREGFIGMRVLPVTEVGKPEGPFPKLVLAEILKNADVERAPGAPYNQVNWVFGKDTFVCREKGLEAAIDRRQAAMYRDYFDQEIQTAALVFDMVMRAAEKRIADAVFNAATWTGAPLTTVITNEWDDAVNAAPRADVKAAKIKVWEGTGLRANTLIINHIVFENLIDCATIIDRLKYAGFTDPRPANITPRALAQALNIDQVLVAGGAQNTAAEPQTPSIANLWSNEYAMVCRVAEGRGVNEACIGRTLHWGEDGSTVGGTVETYYNVDVRADKVRVRHDVDEKIMLVGAGHLLSNVTT